MRRYFLVIGWALFIDLLQAGISFALAGFMGTIGGAAAGALTCSKYIPSALQSETLTAACTTVGGVLGTFGNPVLVPIGVAIGFVINICLSLTMGAALVLALVSVCDWRSVQKYLMPGFIGDAIPGINNLPFWTFLAIASSWEHSKQKGKLGIAGTAVGVAIAPTRAIMSMKEDTMSLAQKAKVFRPEQQNRISQEEAVGSMQKKVAESRVPMQDIRMNPPRATPTPRHA